MGYFEHCCQLCGVSFAIARIRRPDEPEENGWCRYSPDYPVAGTELDPECQSSGCQLDNKDNRYESEHIAGPQCCSTKGYSGYRISAEEMKGCRDVQCLLFKPASWQSEPDDQPFEIESDYFLTGIGNGSPDGGKLEGLKPVRHGVSELWISNTLFEFADCPVSERGVPFHPTCFEMFKKISLLRVGRVDISGLCYWRSHILGHDNRKFLFQYPRSIAVHHARSQWWSHEPGTEYLTANPIDIPGLPLLISRFVDCRAPVPATTTGDRFPRVVYTEQLDEGTAVQKVPRDPFAVLPVDITLLILSHCSSRDFTNLRLVTRAYQEVPMTCFRDFLLQDMPWFWEARDLPIASTDWLGLYECVKFVWGNLKGLQNRKRIWSDIDDLMGNIAMYRRDGKFPDTITGPIPGCEGHGGLEFRRQTAFRSVGGNPPPRQLLSRPRVI